MRLFTLVILCVFLQSFILGQKTESPKIKFERIKVESNTIKFYHKGAPKSRFAMLHMIHRNIELFWKGRASSEYIEFKRNHYIKRYYAFQMGLGGFRMHMVPEGKLQGLKVYEFFSKSGGYRVYFCVRKGKKTNNVLNLISRIDKIRLSKRQISTPKGISHVRLPKIFVKKSKVNLFTRIINGPVAAKRSFDLYEIRINQNGISMMQPPGFTVFLGKFDKPLGVLEVRKPFFIWICRNKNTLPFFYAEIERQDWAGGMVSPFFRFKKK